jgi:DNA (cytosine-5)-methyltransferase 1
MAHGDSGRIVIDVELDLKRQLYAALSLKGSTLKDWFRKSAEAFCAETMRPSRFRDARVSETQSPYLPWPKPRNDMTLEPRKAETAYTLVSMFSGCGGMDLGFIGGFEVFGRTYAPLPFRIVWANDNNQAACKTYKENLGHEIKDGSVWDVLDSLPEKADVLVGGFPCQDVSVNGKRRGLNGSRTSLYKAMVKAIEKVKPKVFVAENVKGLLMGENQGWAKQVLDDFKALGYEVQKPKIYRAADYGVPQTRERIFFVGTAAGVKPFAPPPAERNAATWMTAKEALADLESIEESPEINHIWSRANKSPEQGNRRLIPGRPAYTIRAECHGNIQYHYSLPRRISMREAARIQSFPDSFIFHAKLRETERQVGNAVPPVLAWHMAKAVLACLE